MIAYLAIEPADRKITVLLADDHPIVSAGLVALVETAGDMEIVGEAVDGREAVAAALRLRPDVILMDVAMPLLNGVDATRQILRSQPRIKVLIVSSHDDKSRIDAALDAGVAGYLFKSTMGATLLESIRAVSQGKSCFAPEIMEHVAAHWQKRHPDGRPRKAEIPRLSCRQSEVLQLIAEGFSTKEIARMIGISSKTVDKHRQSLMDKLQIHEISTLTRYAASVGIIELNRTPLVPEALVSASRPHRPAPLSHGAVL